MHKPSLTALTTGLSVLSLALADGSGAKLKKKIELGMIVAGGVEFMLLSVNVLLSCNLTCLSSFLDKVFLLSFIMILLVVSQIIYLTVS